MHCVTYSLVRETCFCAQMVWPMFGRKESCEYLGLYGMAGAGKSTLCKAMCNYSQAEFGANVFLLDLTSGDSLSRLKTLLEQMGVMNITLSKVATIEQVNGSLMCCFQVLK